METEWQRWHAVGCYISPDKTSTIEDVITTISRRPQGENMMVAGKINLYLCISWRHPKDWHLKSESEKISFILVPILVILGKAQDNGIKSLSRSQIPVFITKYV